MKIKTIFSGVIFILLFVSPVLAQIKENTNQEKSPNLTEWIIQSLKEIEKVKIGMTRADLLKLFMTEGGLSTGVQRTYVYRKCPYIKVDVEFEPVGRPTRGKDGRVTLVEAEEDEIKKISQPYLAWSITD